MIFFRKIFFSKEIHRSGANFTLEGVLTDGFFLIKDTSEGWTVCKGK